MLPWWFYSTFYHSARIYVFIHLLIEQFVICVRIKFLYISCLLLSSSLLFWPFPQNTHLFSMEPALFVLLGCFSIQVTMHKILQCSTQTSNSTQTTLQNQSPFWKDNEPCTWGCYGVTSLRLGFGDQGLGDPAHGKEASRSQPIDVLLELRCTQKVSSWMPTPRASRQERTYSWRRGFHGDGASRATGGAPGQCLWNPVEHSVYSGSGTAGVEKVNLHLRGFQHLLHSEDLPRKHQGGSS